MELMTKHTQKYNPNPLDINFRRETTEGISERPFMQEASACVQYFRNSHRKIVNVRENNLEILNHIFFLVLKT